MSGERRQFERKKHSFPARIRDHVTGETIVCQVCDISQAGASLRMAFADVPKRFKLLLSNDGRIARDCKVVWQRGIDLGVEFLSR
jgi:hypothetical protein